MIIKGRIQSTPCLQKNDLFKNRSHTLTANISTNSWSDLATKTSFQFCNPQDKLIPKLPYFARFDQELVEIFTVKEKETIFESTTSFCRTAALKLSMSGPLSLAVPVFNDVNTGLPLWQSTLTRRSVSIKEFGIVSPWPSSSGPVWWSRCYGRLMRSSAPLSKCSSVLNQGVEDMATEWKLKIIISILCIWHVYLTSLHVSICFRLCQHTFDTVWLHSVRSLVYSFILSELEYGLALYRG